MNRKSKLALLIVIFLTVLSLGHLSRQNEGNPKLPSLKKTTSYLRVEDPLFMYQSPWHIPNDNKSQIQIYKWLLAHDWSTYEDAQYFKYKLGTLLVLDEKYSEGIVLLKEVVTSNASNHLRARAVEYMGRSFHKTRDPQLTAAIFSTEPYRSFLNGVTEPEACERLFEYAASIYPLPISELRIAKAHADTILEISRKKTTTPIDTEAIIYSKKMINRKLESVEVELARDNYENEMPEITQRYAAIYGTLYLAGDTTFGDPENLYREAISLADNSGQRGFALFHYAVYLAQLDEIGRKKDIIQLLQNFYRTDEYEGSNIFTFFENIKEDAEVTNRGTLRLTRVDPHFKEFLETRFGWVIN